MSLVLFDFDGTLTTRDTIWPFASFLCKESGRSGGTRLSILLSLLMLKFRLVSNHSFKERLLRLLVRGEAEPSIAERTEKFHQMRLNSLLNQPVVRALLKHAAAGDDVYLVSSNFDFFLRPLQQRWKLKGIFATETEVAGGHFTGRISGRACDGEEKLARVVAFFGERTARGAEAYGDSRGDSFLLGFVKTGHWVGPHNANRTARSLRPA